MIKKVIEYIKEHQLIDPQDKIVVGVSGGADSMCLLLVLLELKKLFSFNLVVAHIEHGIRGEESLKDAIFVEKIAEKENILFQKYTYSVPELAKEWKMTMEEAGRKVRYQAFEQACEEFQANKIAVAHHADDNAETILLHLLRGAGIHGLSGMEPKRGKILRPLLCVSRKDIEQYLEERKQQYCVDSTNLVDEYTRNKIRLQLLPFIEENLNANIKMQLNQTGMILQEIEEYMKQEGTLAYQTCVKKEAEEKEILLSAFDSYHGAVKKEIIRFWLEDSIGSLKDITAKHIEAIGQLAVKQVGKQVVLPGEWLAVRTYDSLTIRMKKHSRVGTMVGSDLQNEESGVYIIPPCQYTFGEYDFSFEVMTYQEKEAFPDKAYTKWFDYDKIKDTLRLRYRESGDYIEINHTKGRKKCKDYFIDQKIPKEERDYIPMLADEHHVLWMVGYRISEGYKITMDTKNILKVQVNGGKENGRQN